MRELVEWCRNEENRTVGDPIGELLGLGKAAWRELGGGERILAWLRADDPESQPPWDRSAERDRVS